MLLAAELSPMQNGQPWLLGRLSRFHSTMPAEPRPTLSTDASCANSPTPTMPGLAGSVCSVNGWRKPIA